MADISGEDTIVSLPERLSGAGKDDAQRLNRETAQWLERLERIEERCARLEAKGEKLEAYLRMMEREIEEIGAAVRRLEKLLQPRR